MFPVLQAASSCDASGSLPPQLWLSACRADRDADVKPAMETGAWCLVSSPCFPSHCVFTAAASPLAAAVLSAQDLAVAVVHQQIEDAVGAARQWFL